MNIKHNLTNTSIVLKSYVNKYAFIGLGIAVFSILIATCIVSYQITGSISLNGFIKAQLTNPAIWVLDLTPFIFAYWGQSFCYSLMNRAKTILSNTTSEFLNKSGDLEGQLKYEVQHDSLTHLPNSRLLKEQIIESIKQLNNSGELAVVILKINGFKQLHNYFGNFNVNQALIEYSKTIQSVLLEHSILEATIGINSAARLDHDEFALLLRRLNMNVDRNKLLASIINSTTTSIMVDGIPVPFTPVAAIATYPFQADNEETLINNARTAVYHARKEGKPYMVYHKSMDEGFSINRALMNQLGQAIEQNTLKIHYQPIYELATRKIVGAESIVLLEHDKAGLIPVEKFMPLIEASPLVHKVTEFLLANSIKQLQKWQQEGFMIFGAIHLATKDSVNNDLPSLIEMMLHEHKVNPDHLKLELTEQACLLDPTKTAEILHQISSLGVQLTIADFNSSFSSFVSLSNLPIHELKIEKSLIMNMGKDPTKSNVIEGIIRVANSLGLKTSADEISDVKTAELLKEYGCVYGQGSHFSQALDALEFSILLQKPSQ
ncbi:phosphodiesterase [Legionella waltersii]|nr:phosphodiesterase [Legionella waltersii]